MRLALYTKTWRNSGTGLFAMELANSLAERRCEVEYIAPPLEAEKELRNVLISRRVTAREKLNGDRLSRALQSLRRCFGSVALVLRARLRTKIFIISAPDPLPFLLIILIALRFSGARVLYIVHDPIPHKWFLPEPLRWLECLTLNLTYTLSSFNIVLSDASKSTMQRRYPRSSPIYVIPHGVFPPIIRGINEGPQNLLVFGTIRANKGVYQAIAAVILCRNRGLSITLTIAGEPHPSDIEYYHRCAELASTEPTGIIFRGGYVADNELAELLKNCDALLMPYTDFYSQSGVAILAACNSRPLIASSAGGLADLRRIGMPFQAIEDASSADSISMAISAFYEVEKNAWTDLSSAFQTKFLADCSWLTLAQCYIDLAEGA